MDDIDFGQVILGILIFLLWLILGALAICLTVIAIAAALTSGVFVSFASAIKSCVIGINGQVGNLFVKVVLFIVLALFILALLVPIVWFSVQGILLLI